MPGGIKGLIGIVVLIILAIILVPQFFYVVDETNQALVLRFGDFDRVKQKPGLNVKIPFIEEVIKFDQRLLRFDAPPEALITADKKNLVIDAYARYKITDPKVLFEAVGDEAGADSRLRDIISGELKKQIALFNLSDIIQTQRQTGTIGGRPTIVQAVLDESKVRARTFGIEMIDFRIKRADLTETIQQSIFQRMNAERQREAALFRAEGSEADARIRASAERTRTITLASARRDADIILGCGESVAVAIFAEAFNKDPEFFNFQRSLEAYSKSLANQDTLVLSAESELLRYLQGHEGVLDGQLPPGLPGVLGGVTSAPSGPIQVSGETKVTEKYTQDRITQLIRDCERQSGFVQDISGPVENAEVVRIFEAGLTTTTIVWTVSGVSFVLTDTETEIIGDPAFANLLPSQITSEQIVGREVDVVARREPGDRLLAIEINVK